MGHADLHFMTHKSMSQGCPEVQPPICLSHFHNSKVEKISVRDLDLNVTDVGCDGTA